MATEIQDMIRRLAVEADVDPAYALAVAQRESRFDPNARASRTIAGLFQMRGDHRQRFGVPDDADPETQTRGFAGFTNALRDEMTRHLGRAPTDSELYLGHYLGGQRAARALTDHADLSPRDVFSPQELTINPEFKRHPTMGSLASAVTADMDKRMARFSSTTPDAPRAPARDFSAFGTPEPVNFSAFGEPDKPVSTFPPSNDAPKSDTPQTPLVGGRPFDEPQPAAARPGTEVDLNQFASAWPQPLPMPTAQPPLPITPVPAPQVRRPDSVEALAEPYAPPDVAKGDVGAIR